MADLKERIIPYCLHNAIEYGGKANPGSVLGKVLGENEDLRKSVPEVKKVVEEVVKEVNKLSLDQQKDRLEKSGVKFERKEKEEKKLPDLPEAEKGVVVMRMAPNPNGPLHIGHSRMAILNDEYAKKYGGTLMLRFDDTDPKNENKVPMLEAYDWIQEDLKWLGINFDRVETASSRIEVYYKYFEKVLEAGHAYICFCEQEKWSNLVRRDGGVCPCRSHTAQENVSKWKDMVLWKLKEGEAVGRIKTDLEEKNPAVKDWVAFRTVDDPQHPIVRKRIKVWPTLDFASAIDDHEFGITHIVRGKDLAVSELRQKFLYNYMGWKYPVTKVYGKFMTSDDLVISKSKIQEGIKKGVYSGYDDPKLVFLRALKRRGILPQTIRNYILALGLSEAETTVDLEILFSENRKLIDPEANRYMVVLEPEEIDISEPLKKSGKNEVEIKYHPDKKETRKISVSNKIFVSGEDLKTLKGKDVRLIDLFNVKLDKEAVYSKSQEFGFETKKLQWVSDDFVKVKLVTPEGVKEGVGEKALLKLKPDDMIQMLRIGFGRVDSVGKDQITIYFAHK
ncbi:MAG: glutamate--tRNA ligase [Candidatus Aenigmarchaeota archaeon]|nr:glutamate--tRNA ligase [Candidatus Aenigmarchaeota archaeon]